MNHIDYHKEGIEGLPLYLLIATIVIVMATGIFGGIMQYLKSDQLSQIVVTPAQVTLTTSTSSVTITVTAYSQTSKLLPNVRVTLNGTGVDAGGVTNGNGAVTFQVTPQLINHQTSGIIEVAASYFTTGIFMPTTPQYVYSEVVVVE